MSKPQKVVLALLAVPVFIAALLLGAWALDGRSHEGQAVRSTRLAGIDVGGQSRERLLQTVDELDRTFPSTKITVTTDDGVTLDGSAGELGLTLDREGTADAAMAVGRRGDGSPIMWLRSLWEPRSVNVALQVDDARLDSAITELEGDRRTQPREPTLAADAEGVRLVAGEPGRRIDAAAVAKALPRDLQGIGAPIAVTVQRTVTPPRLSDDTVGQLATTAQNATTGEVTLVAGERRVKMDAAEFRPFVALTVQGDTPTLTMDVEQSRKLVQSKFPPQGNPTGVRFTMGAGGLEPTGGKDAAVCCGDGVGTVVTDALLKGSKEIALPTRTMTAAEGLEWARGLGVKEVIGEFTTNHACCEARVSNIHLISDMTRGVLIAPGDTFSINNLVGKRTPEKGFKVAPVIENGKMSEDYGGGISQYATTLFNAAFFGGLDIPAYKAHSHYISRYPFGREATVAFPGVDLKVKNITPYGVVVWPTYTDTSVTLRLYSTKYVSGQQTGRSKDSGCGKVTVQRTRTWVDGKTAKDTFNADYDCNPE